MYAICKSIGCNAVIPEGVTDFCPECSKASEKISEQPTHSEELSLKYPQYYKPVGELTSIDVYAVHKLFNIEDPSGCLHHASKKLLLSGVRTGKKTAYQDIKEARDTLTRWLHLNHDLR